MLYSVYFMDKHQMIFFKSVKTPVATQKLVSTLSYAPNKI